MPAPIPAKLASFIADFASTHRFKAVVDSPTLGMSFTILIYVSENYTLHSFYGTCSGPAIKPSTVKREIISLGADTEFPIKTIISKRTATRIVNTYTREVIAEANTPIGDELNDIPDLSGSILIIYKPFDAQVFSHSAIKKAGDYVLFATSENGCKQDIKFSLSEDLSKPIKIEAYPLPPQIGFIPYARFIVYPANLNLIIKTNAGSATLHETITQTIKAESISFSGRESSANFDIDSLVAINGYFFDGYGNHITPEFSVANGKLVASVDCWGVAYIDYQTQGKVYDYFAQIAGTTITTGSIFAFDPKQKGIAASYEIPLIAEVGGNREDILTIYREVIVQGSNTFERPENWDSDNAYDHYGSALENEKPVIGDSYAVTQWNHEVVFVQNGAMFTDKPGVAWYAPTAGDAFNGVVYKLTSNIPTAPTDTIDAAMITALLAKEVELKTKYGIA